MACSDMSEADQVGRLMQELNTGCLVTYRRTQDVMSNAPAGKVALIILASEDSPAALGRMLKWLRHRWPDSPVTVIGNQGAGEHEMAARAGGAFYLTRPVATQDWTAILSHVLVGQIGRPSMEETNEGPAGAQSGWS